MKQTILTIFIFINFTVQASAHARTNAAAVATAKKHKHSKSHSQKIRGTVDMATVGPGEYYVQPMAPEVKPKVPVLLDGSFILKLYVNVKKSKPVALAVKDAQNNIRAVSWGEKFNAESTALYYLLETAAQDHRVPLPHTYKTLEKAVKQASGLSCFQGLVTKTKHEIKSTPSVAEPSGDFKDALSDCAKDYADKFGSPEKETDQDRIPASAKNK